MIIANSMSGENFIRALFYNNKITFPPDTRLTDTVLGNAIIAIVALGENRRLDLEELQKILDEAEAKINHMREKFQQCLNTNMNSTKMKSLGMPEECVEQFLVAIANGMPFEKDETSKYNDFKAKTQLALDEKEYIRAAINLEKIKAADAFSRCLASNINNPDLGSSGIPKVCEDSAKILRLFGLSSQVNDQIENFQK